MNHPARMHMSSGDSPRGELPRAVSPDDHVVFRLTQLLLLLRETSPPGVAGIGMERLGYYDFFSANPFLVIPAKDKQDRTRLHLAGFDERQLSYTANGERFASRRRRLQHDVSLLLAYGLVQPRGGGWGLTEAGEQVTDQLTAMYATQYVASVQIVVKRLARFDTDAALARQARHWLREPGLVLDLYGAGTGDEPTNSLGEVDAREEND